MFVCHYVILSRRKSSVSIRHYVILSQKNPLSSSVPLLFCLKKSSVFIRLYVILSSKKSFVSICHYVTLSPIYSVCIVLKSLDNDVYKGLG